MKEVELFEPTKMWLQSKEYEIYSEVVVYSKRADIVAKHNNLITVVEMKTSLTLDLLEQASRWIKDCNLVYVCVPFPKKKHINGYAMKCIKNDGMGLLAVDFDRHYCPSVSEIIRPKLNRYPAMNWYKFLHEEQKTGIPGGSAGGGYVTDYKITIDGIKFELWLHPEGLSLDELVEKCETHYSNPKAGLYKALTKFETDWCENFKIGKKRYFRMREEYKYEQSSFRRGRKF